MPFTDLRTFGAQVGKIKKIESCWKFCLNFIFEILTTLVLQIWQMKKFESRRKFCSNFRFLTTPVLWTMKFAKIKDFSRVEKLTQI